VPSILRTPAPPLQTQTPVLQTPGAAAPAPGTQADQIGPGRSSGRQFTGHPISLDFQGADLRAVLRTFSEISGLNIVIDPAVQGTVDVVLKDVPWDQALDIILRANKLGYFVDGTIVRIAPLTVLADEESQRRKLGEEQALAGQLEVLTKTLSYAKAADLLLLLTKTVLSSRGTVQVDPRTNTLIISDLRDRLTLASDLLATLDRPQPQVEIEARVINTNRNYARALGVQWGFGGRVDPALGNTTNLAFPNNGSLGGTAGGGSTAAPNAVNLAPVHPLVGELGDAGPLEGGRYRFRVRVQLGHELDQLAHRHLGHQATGLEHGADPARLHRAVRVIAEHPDPPAGGLAQREQHVKRGGLARPVRPEQGDGLARAQVERQPVDGPQPSVDLGHVLERDHRTAVAATPVAAVVRGRGRGPVTRLVLAHVIPLLSASSGRLPRPWTPSAPNTTIWAAQPGSAVPQEPPMTCVIPDAVTRPVRGVVRGQIASAFGWKEPQPEPTGTMSTCPFQGRGVSAGRMASSRISAPLIGGADIRNPCGQGTGGLDSC
jgi:hypothetical protein